MSQLLSLPINRATSSNGLPLSGAALHFYLSGTITPAAIYTTSARDVAHENPVRADAAGLFPAIYLDPTVSYRVKLKTGSGADVPGVDFDPVSSPSVGDLSFTAPHSGAVAIAMIAYLAGSGLTPEMFGAKGDGITNDWQAFERLSAVLEAQGGGVVNLGAGKTYIVGKQTLNGAASGIYSWIPEPIIRCRNGTKPIIINGNGATLKAAAGLRYGTFNPVTGEALAVSNPYFGPIYERAAPYEGMIELLSNSGDIVIRDVILDGSGDQHVYIRGGAYGDLGHQIAGSGMMLLLNSGALTIDNVKANNHPFDGLHLCHVANAAVSSNRIRINALECDRNGRQGFSNTGGSNGVVTASKFTRTARQQFGSSPAAGLDMEAELGQRLRNWTYDNCEFSDNVGSGVNGTVNDAADTLFRKCLFIGTTNPSVYDSRPRSRYEDCTFVGSVLSGSSTTSFERCLFTDDPALSPTGLVYSSGGAFLHEETGAGCSYKECCFVAVGAGMKCVSNGPASPIQDCTFSQVSTAGIGTNGQFYGRNFFTFPGAHFGVDPASNIYGKLFVNNADMQKGQRVSAAPIADVASLGSAILDLVPIPFVTPGDKIKVTPSDVIHPFHAEATCRPSDGAVFFSCVNMSAAPATLPAVTFVLEVL